MSKVWAKREQSVFEGPNWAFSLFFHNISSRFCLFWIPQMMLLVTGKRSSFDILPHKKYSLETRQNWQWSQNRPSGNCSDGASWVVVYIPWKSRGSKGGWVNFILKIRCICGQGREGVKKPENFVDIISGSSLRDPWLWSGGNSHTPWRTDGAFSLEMPSLHYSVSRHERTTMMGNASLSLAQRCVILGEGGIQPIICERNHMSFTLDYYWLETMVEIQETWADFSAVFRPLFEQFFCPFELVMELQG